MHIEITQSTGQNESVQTGIGITVINKLYELASQLDSTSTVSGRISLYAASKQKVEYLAGTNGIGGNGRFPNLFINCSTYYFDFLDPEMQRVCSTLYGDGYGVTAAELASVSNISSLSAALTNNTTITTLDLRGITLKNPGGNEFAIGMTSLQNVYIKNINILNLSAFWGNGNNPSGIISNGRTNIKRIIADTVGISRDIANPLRGGTGNNINIEVLAVKQILLADNYSEKKIGDYIFRGSHIDHFYIGETVPPVLTFGYGDNINNATNIYVPIGSSSAYAAANNWSSHTAGFIEYDFDNDPDGIFSVFN